LLIIAANKMLEAHKKVLTRISLCISSKRSDWGSLLMIGLLQMLRACTDDK